MKRLLARCGFLPLVALLALVHWPGPSALAAAVPGGTLTPTTIPKYVSPLVIPPVMPKTTTPAGTPAATYDIAERQFKQQILPTTGCVAPAICTGTAYAPTTVWSYGRAQDAVPPVAPSATSSFNYPAFTVEATVNTPTTVRWINDLKDPITGNFLPHLLSASVDQTIHWANPPQTGCTMGDPNRTDCETAIPTPYTGPVPMVVHVHGSHVQAVSDGYPEAWWLPAANNIPAGYATHGSRFDQADRTNSVPGSAYYSYENTQAAATIWYHDHSLGMTRLNVYAGPAGFWLLRGGPYDISATPTMVLPGPAPIAGQDPNFTVATRQTIREIPIVIQDRSFNTDGSLFYPTSRVFFDGFTGPYIGGTGTPTGPSDISGILNPEAFFNTMVVNGKTWPKFDVAPTGYRFRFLNGCDSRTLNMSFFQVTAGPDGIFGTADDVKGAEVPVYQIGGDQGFLPHPVMITKGFATTLNGTGTIPAAVASPSPEQGLLMAPAERADTIIDFTGLANGTHVRIFNSAPDSPFQGFPAGLVGYIPADPLTSGQVMDFVVNTALPAQPTDASRTPVASLTLPAQPAIGTPTNTRQVSFNELDSTQVCVEVNTLTGAIVKTLFSTTPGDPTFLATCAATPVAAGDTALPVGPRQTLLGTVKHSGASLVTVPKRWMDPITEAPSLNAVEMWEAYNTTADGHPMHIHLVHFNVVNRQALDPTQLALGNLVPTGTPIPPMANEVGGKDTVIAYPGQVLRVKAKYDIPGVYVWHCHILEHEDNEMMLPFVVFTDSLFAGYTGAGLWERRDGTTWNQLSGTVPVKSAASNRVIYCDFGASGLWQWNGTTWTMLASASPTILSTEGSFLYAGFGTSGLWQWSDATKTWTMIAPTSPTMMTTGGAKGDVLYASFGGAGLWQFANGAWRQLSASTPNQLEAEESVLYAVFPVSGLWRWNGTAWSILTGEVTGSKIAILDNPSGSHLFVNLRAGVWEWNDPHGMWMQVDTASPTQMITTGQYLYGNYGVSGIKQYDPVRQQWTTITSSAVVSMAASGTMLYGDFGASGLWQFSNGSWTPLSGVSPASMSADYSF